MKYIKFSKFPWWLAHLIWRHEWVHVIIKWTTDYNLNRVIFGEDEVAEMTAYYWERDTH